MVIACVHLFFSFHYRPSRQDFSCAFVSWFIPHAASGEQPDPDNGMWTVHLERNCRTGHPVYQVINIQVDASAIAHAAHLLPVFGSDRVPEDFDHNYSLDSFKSFFVNHYVDHHAHEFLTG